MARSILETIIISKLQPPEAAASTGVMTGKFLFSGAVREFDANYVDDKPWANRPTCFELRALAHTLAHGSDHARCHTDETITCPTNRAPRGSGRSALRP